MAKLATVQFSPGLALFMPNLNFIEGSVWKSQTQGFVVLHNHSFIGPSTMMQIDSWDNTGETLSKKKMTGFPLYYPN